MTWKTSKIRTRRVWRSKVGTKASPFTAKLLLTARKALSLGRAAYRAGNRAVAARAAAVAKRAFKLAKLAAYVQRQSVGIASASRVMHVKARAAKQRAAFRRTVAWNAARAAKKRAAIRRTAAWKAARVARVTGTWKPVQRTVQRRRRGPVRLAYAPAWS